MKYCVCVLKSQLCLFIVYARKKGALPVPRPPSVSCGCWWQLEKPGKKHDGKGKKKGVEGKKILINGVEIFSTKPDNFLPASYTESWILVFNYNANSPFLAIEISLETKQLVLFCINLWDN